MTINKPNVKRYDDMGCPEQICRVDTMQESDDGDFVLYEDYKALQAECDQLRKDAERYRFLCDLVGADEDCLAHAINTLNSWVDKTEIDQVVDYAMQGRNHDNR